MPKKSPEQINEIRLEASYAATDYCPRCGIKLSIEQNNQIKNGKINNIKCCSLICR